MSNVREMYYEISIGGKPLDDLRMSMIEEIQVEDASTGADTLTIMINDPDMIFLEDAIFVEETPVTFKGGWKDEVDIEFEGYISMIDVDFAESGSPTLSIFCLDNSHLLNRDKKKRTWENIRISDIALQIFKEHGLKADVDTTPKIHDSIAQSNITDIEFLIDLSGKEIDQYIIYIEKDKGYFKKKQLLETPQATLNYMKGASEIQSFSPRINKEIKQVEVEVADIDDKTKESDTGIATDSVARDVQGEPVEGSAKKGSNDSNELIWNGTEWVPVQSELGVVKVNFD